MVLQLLPADTERFAAAFDAAERYVPPIDTLIAETARARHGHFNVIHRDVRKLE